MVISRHVGLVAAPGGIAPVPLRGLVVALLAAAVAMGRLDWWKLLERAGRVHACGNRGWLSAAALGLTLSGAGGAEEFAADEEGRLLDAMKHAALKLMLEATVFYALVAIAVTCGLTVGADGDRSDLLAYLADTLAGGWGEPMIYAGASMVLIAASAAARAVLLIPRDLTTARRHRDDRWRAPRPFPPGGLACERSAGCRRFW